MGPDIGTVEGIKNGIIPNPLIGDESDTAHQVHIPVEDGEGNVGKFVVEKDKKPHYVGAAKVTEYGEIPLSDIEGA